MLRKIEKLFRTIAEQRGLHNPKIDIGSGNKADKGFRGDIYIVSVVDDKVRRLDSVVKCGSIDQQIVSEYHIREVFENEALFYKELLPAIREFQEKRRVPHPFKSVAEYYGSQLDESARLIALQNLKTSGFELFNKRLTFDVNYVDIVFEEYGKLHGAFFVYRNQNEDQFEQLTSKIHNCWKMYMEEKAFVTLLTVNYEEVSTILTSQALLADKFKKFLDAPRVFRDVCAYKGKYPTLTHGDCWSNNFMFKYKQNIDGCKELDDLRIIDWQNVGVGTPVYDLSYFLYANASKAEFDNLDHHLEVYHNSLSRTITDLGGNPDVLYPLQALKCEWKEYAVFGFMMGLMLQKLKLREDVMVDIANFDDDKTGEKLTKEICNTKFDNETYKKRVLELVSHMYEIGVL